MNHDSTILVCGAGPVGLTAALELASHGLRPRIIDSNDGPTDLSKALVVWRRTLKSIDGLVPFERFLRDHVPMRSARIMSDGRAIASIDLTEERIGETAFPTGVLVPQSTTERLLIEALAEHDVRVERGTRLLGLVPATTGGTVRIEGPRGVETVETDWLLACDGGHSTIRKALDLPFPGATLDHRWLIADVAIEQASDPSQIRIELDRGGVVAVFPVGAGRWRVVADLGRCDEEASEPTLADVQRVLDTRTTLEWTATEAYWLGHFRINERQIERYRHGRMLFAGDAAHVHSPAGGQGMNTGMQDAQNLAWKLAVHLRGGAGDPLLDTYHDERHPVGHQVIRDSARMLRMTMLTNRLARTARNSIVHLGMSTATVRRRFRAMISEDAIDYRSNRLADGTRVGGLRSGDPLPEFEVLVGGRPTPLHHLLRGAAATVLVIGPVIPAGLPGSFGVNGRGLTLGIRRLGVGGDAEDPGGSCTDALGGTGRLILVRPDGVIATIVDSPVGVQAWMASAFGDPAAS